MDGTDESVKRAGGRAAAGAIGEAGEVPRGSGGRPSIFHTLQIIGFMRSTPFRR